MANSVMRFVLEGRDNLSRVLDNAGDAARRLQRRLEEAERNSSRSTGRMQREAVDLRSVLISLAPAAAPVAAALAPIAVQAGAAGAAMAAFGAAVVPQVSALKDAADAEKKYTDAVKKSGATSKDAINAQIAYHEQVANMPPATREASAALSVLKDTYQDWSDALAKDTMPVFTKGLQTATAVMPKFTGLAKGAAGQLDRLVTVAAGAFATPGFDRLMGKFTEFAVGSLRKATDGVVRFLATLSTGEIGGGLSRFMDYARSVGPQVAETLKNVARALGNVLLAASNAGGGILQLVNVFAKMVAALPTGFLTVLIQGYTALKLFSLGANLVSAVITPSLISRVAGFVAAARFGGLASAASGFVQSMSATSKAVGVAALAFAAFYAGQKIGETFWSKTPVSAEHVAKALAKMGEAGRMAAPDIRTLADSAARLKQTSIADTIYDYGTFHANQEWKKASGDFDAWDRELSELVGSGNMPAAKNAFDQISASLRKQGVSAKDIQSLFPEYQKALAGSRLEAKLTADAMGLFGQSAGDVKAKLDAQKLSADGLRQSYQALSTTMLEARGGIRGMEAAIDAATDAVKKNGRTLDENTAKGRANNQALDDIASSTMKAASAARENGSSWATVSSIYDRGRSALVKTAKQMGLTGREAEKLADKILKVPDKKVMFRGDAKDLKAKIADAQRKVDALKQKRAVAVGADKRRLDAAVSKAQRHVDSLRQKRAAVLNAVDHTGAGVRAAMRNIEKVHGKNVYINVSTVLSAQARRLAREGKLARGGLVHRFASGGQVQGYPGGGAVYGPGTATSDSIPAWLSNGEFVVRAAAVRKYGVQFFERLNGMRTQGLPRWAGASVAARAHGGGSPIVVNVNGALDPVAVGKQLRKILLELKRTYGTNVQLGVA